MNASVCQGFAAPAKLLLVLALVIERISPLQGTLYGRSFIDFIHGYAYNKLCEIVAFLLVVFSPNALAALGGVALTDKLQRG